jgi:hypothetical protein
MGSNRHARSLRALGSHDKRDTERIYPQIVIRFDRETFDQVAAAALKKQISFAEQVRLYCVWGIENEEAR